MTAVSRAERQRRNRATVLRAARAEFTARGYRDAKIDAIADRAGLTRGAVYSNFPGKRALYFAVLADIAEHAAPAAPTAPARTLRAALGDIARAATAAHPLSGDGRRLGDDLLPEVAADERVRLPYARLLALDAVLTGLALEPLGPGRRLVGLAETLLTLLAGARELAAAAPGFGDPFRLVTACEALADAADEDVWDPPHLPYAPAPRAVDDPWTAPPAVDVLGGDSAVTGPDGVVAVLGLHRLDAVEEAVRAAPPGLPVTLAAVTGDPAELLPLASLMLAGTRARLRSFGAVARVGVILDHAETNAVAGAAGVTAVSDATEAAVLVTGGRITARSEGRGACHAVASATEG